MMKKVRTIFLVLLGVLVVTPLLAKPKRPLPRSESDRRKAEYIFLEAQNQKQQEHGAAFFDLVRYAHRLDPENTAITYYYGYCTLLMQDVTKRQFEEGLALMRQHVDAHPTDFYESMLYSDACMAVGQIEESVRVLRQLSVAKPNTTEIQARLADAYASLGDFPGVIAVCDSIEVTQGKSVALSARKVQAYQELNDTLGALREMHSLLSTAPRNASYNMAMAAMLQKFGEADSALVYLDRAQQYEPDNGATYLAKADFYSQIGDSVNYDRQIELALVSKDLEVESKIQVLADYTRRQLVARDSSQRVANLFHVLIRQHPHEPTIRSLYSEYFVAKQDYKAAVEQLSYQLDLDPTDAKAWQRMMLVNMMDDNYPAAIECANRALELNPDSLELYGYIAPAYYEMKEYDKAIATYRRALEICDSNDISTRSNLMGGMGDVRAAMGDTLKAMELYEEALKVFAGNISVLNNYAYFLACCNRDLDRAERMSARAVKEDPENSTFIDTYAWVFYKKKDYSMALFYIESAIKNDQTGSGDLLDHYGDILYMSGNHEKAVEQWEKALEKLPDNDKIKKKVEEKKL